MSQELRNIYNKDLNQVSYKNVDHCTFSSASVSVSYTRAGDNVGRTNLLKHLMECMHMFIESHLEMYLNCSCVETIFSFWDDINGWDNNTRW